jgi:hypothetical protein
MLTIMPVICGVARFHKSIGCPVEFKFQIDCLQLDILLLRIIHCLSEMRYILTIIH